MADTPTLFITGATGQLGSLVIDALLKRVPPSAILAGARDLDGEGAAALRLKGVEVREADYTRPDTLATAFAGVDRLLLVSSSENGKRREQHRNVIDASKAAGVGLVAYTSILHADTTPLFLAEEHRDTEAALKTSGLPHVLLRNGWYNEVYTWRLPSAFQRGELIGAARDGRVSSAARVDYAEAAAVVLAEDGHAGHTYELAGDDSFTMTDLSAVATAAGAPIGYRNIDADAFHTALLEAGTPEMMARILFDTDAGIADGALFDDGGALSRLIGRPTTPYQRTIEAFVHQYRADRTATR